MKIAIALLLTFLIIGTFTAKYYKDNFEGDWEKRWVHSNREGLGKFVVQDGGLKTSQDAKFYAISSELAATLNTKGKTVVVQLVVKNGQGIDCGGGYLKILRDNLKQTDFKGDSEYGIMFGPDICGSTKKVHLIFNFNGKNLDWKKSLECPSDKLSHVYTAIVRPDDTYEVLIDGEKKDSGKLSEDWDFMEPKRIPDPDAKKPEDWVDEQEILDPEDKKPEDWDNIPKTIVDPEAKKPEDWNEEEDGKWEAPTISNPEYKGEWVQKKIPNPKYKGEWQRPEIDNKNYKEHKDLHAQDKLKFVGFDLWQVKSGTVFSHVLISDSVEDAEEDRKVISELQKKEKEEEEVRAKKEEEDAKLRAEATKKEEEEKAKKEQAEKEKDLDKRADELKKESEASEKKDTKDEL